MRFSGVRASAHPHPDRLFDLATTSAPRPQVKATQVRGLTSSHVSTLIAVDLFAGAGGTTLALNRAGFDVPVAVEVDPTKAHTLKSNLPQTVVLGDEGTVGDVTLVDALDLYGAGLPRDRPLDLLVACPPCQGYSTQGRHNPKDPRNRLFEDILRLTGELDPRAAVVENVPGMASTAGGRFLSELMSGLAALGYDVDLWVLRADELGVPQQRERLFVIASKVGLPQRPARRPSPSVWEAIADLPSRRFLRLEKRGRPLRYKREAASQYARALRAQEQSVTGVDESRHAAHLRSRFSKLRWGKIDPTTKHRRLNPNRPAGTITAGTRSRTACRPVHPHQDRVLTVREGARLASFPDWYQFPPVISEAWTEIGNAVPPLMAEAVFGQLRVALEAK